MPRALAGATAIGMNETLWVFGGVKEEDFYNYDNYYEDALVHESNLEHYDYVVEQTGNGKHLNQVKVERVFRHGIGSLG